MDEFGLIRRYFTRAARANDVIIGVGDDGAVVSPTPGMQQVQVIDTLVERVHFPSQMKADDLGYRVVAVNVSDIAAMAAMPRWMTLALTLPDKGERWVEDFASGLFAAALDYDVELIGGDTTRGDMVVATVHVTGEVEEGMALLRSGAQVGDTVYVSGTTGDAAAGLARFGVSLPNSYLVNRFLRPTPRLELGRAIAGLATACIDVSDGLAGDLAKLCEASGVGAEIDIDRLPVSGELVDAVAQEEAFEFALTGGDDYELCFTAQPDAVADIKDITPIGTVTTSGKVVCRRGGKIVEVDDRGYRHFV